MVEAIKGDRLATPCPERVNETMPAPRATPAMPGTRGESIANWQQQPTKKEGSNTVNTICEGSERIACPSPQSCTFVHTEDEKWGEELFLGAEELDLCKRGKPPDLVNGEQFREENFLEKLCRSLPSQTMLHCHLI